VKRFLNNSYRRIPVKDEEGHIIGQISRRDLLLAFESMRDNPRLYGAKEERHELEDSPGVDTAMKMARSQPRGFAP
jgi:CBS domain containing-hemolysin-like protein